jgi:hypothetical protein
MQLMFEQSRKSFGLGDFMGDLPVKEEMFQHLKPIKDLP